MKAGSKTLLGPLVAGAALGVTFSTFSSTTQNFVGGRRLRDGRLLGVDGGDLFFLGVIAGFSGAASSAGARWRVVAFFVYALVPTGFAFALVLLLDFLWGNALSSSSSWQRRFGLRFRVWLAVRSRVVSGIEEESNAGAGCDVTGDLERISEGGPLLVWADESCLQESEPMLDVGFGGVDESDERGDELGSCCDMSVLLSCTITGDSTVCCVDDFESLPSRGKRGVSLRVGVSTGEVLQFLVEVESGESRRCCQIVEVCYLRTRCTGFRRKRQDSVYYSIFMHIKNTRRLVGRYGGTIFHAT